MIVRPAVPAALRPSVRLAAPPVAAAVAAALTLVTAGPPPGAGDAALRAVQAEPGEGPPGGSSDDVPRIDSDEVVLRWLDKSTARVDEVAVPVGTSVTLGGVEVTARACRRTAPDQTPEHAAFLTVIGMAPGEAPHQIFQGWMFASSPSLAALEHPVYDVWVLECRDAPQSGDSSAASSPDAASGAQ
jgi:hypothetical protein